MATKKDSIQKEQKMSASRAEPRAVNLIIPRRELLTGAALVLVGGASGCGHSAPTPCPLPAAGAGPRLRTLFTEAFTKEFIGDPTKILDPANPPPNDPWPDPSRIWPVKNQTSVSVLNDYLTFLNVLMTVGYVPAPAPAAPSGSLGDRIAQFIQAQNWPTKTALVPGSPSAYDGVSLNTVHLVEIGVIQDRLLQAINSFGAGPGGGGSSWPPH